MQQSLSCNHIFYENDTIKSTHNRIIRSYSKYVGRYGLIPVLPNISYGICSMPKESKHTTIFLSMNNEAQCVPLLCLSSRFMIYAPFFILVKLSLEKNTIETRFMIEILSNLDIA